MTPRATVSARSLRGIRRPRGFALLIVVILLAFVVVMLVGLAAYTRIESSIAGNTQRQAQARQNALLGLNIALGQLQKYAGPDKRVTATAAAFSPTASTRNYTGVWASDPTDDPDGDPLTPLTWLASGNETVNADGTPANPLAITPSSTLSTTTSVALVSTNTSRTTNDVLARLMPITASGLPGTAATTSTTIGRYAWWVGDQGVKAPVATADNSAAVNYAPFGDGTTQNDLGRRLTQQIGTGPAATDANGNPVFEIRDANNTPLVAGEKIVAQSQLAFLKTPLNAALGLRTVQQNYHNWTTNNFAVLANTKLGGLRQDLSLDPTLLGPAFAAWANYTNYMEDPAAPLNPVPLQPYSADPVRRRYVMQPADAAYPIAPVLSFFGLSFSIRNDLSTSKPTQLEVAARCVIGLWNPYTAALVPDKGGYQLRVTGLPDVTVTDSTGDSRVAALQTVMGNGSMKFFLPWSDDTTRDDRSSWLPGRVYNWSALESTSDPGDPGITTAFYERNAVQKEGVVRVIGAPLSPSLPGKEVYRQCSTTAPTVLTVELWRVSDGVKLAEFQSPPFEVFATSDRVLQTDHKYVDFAFIFRLPNSNEIPVGETATWLQAAGRDPRETKLPSSAFVVAGNAPDPSLFGGLNRVGFDASYPDLLLDRYTDAGAANYNEDVPVFELPRSPILSLGTLQHFRIAGARPFAIGNSWTAGADLNGTRVDELFDRFFFSGLASGVTPVVSSGGITLPSPLLRLQKRDASSGIALTPADVLTAPAARSSKFLLQGGSFNLNSISKVAWVSVLRGIRFPSGKEFSFLDSDPATGTSADANANLTSPNATTAAFLRFGQSAEETYKADDNYVQSDPGGSGPVINTPLYRRGVRVLSSSEVSSLADAIVALVQQRHKASGPFTSLEQFLSPTSPGNPSLLEQAIADAGINASIAEFSSQWLTQADIMTALAPYLFPRSDTFVVRAYGEAVNPATGATEGRAWCEATVQRLPEYFDRAADAAEVAPLELTSELNKTFGRRFRIVSFRWLTRSDI